MEPMDTDKPATNGDQPAEPTSKPTISPAVEASVEAEFARDQESLKRAKEEASESEEGSKKPSKKHKKNAPPVVKRKTAILDSDDEEAEAPAAAQSNGDATPAVKPEDAHQVLSTAIKVDPSLPNPPEMSTDSAPAPFATPAAASPSSKPKLSNGVKKEDASSDMSEEDVPLASKAGPSRSPSIPKEKDDKPLAKLPKMKRKESYEAKKEKKANEDVKMDSEDEEDVPLKKTAPKRAAKGKKAFQDEDSDDETAGGQASSAYEEEKPKSKKAAPKRKAAPKKKAKKAGSSDLSSEDEKPLKKKAAEKKAPAPKKVKKEAKAEEGEGEDKKMTAAEKKKAMAEAKKKAKKEEEDAEEEEKYKWWEHQKEDSTVKWETLSHNGVLFPPPYEPLPSHVKMKYDGQEVILPPESEEVAGFFGKMIETDHAQDKIFRKNFFNDFLTTLKKFPPKNNVKITNLDKCDFGPMYAYFEEEREKTKSLNAAAKKEIKKARDESEAVYQYCILDGRKEKIGNFRVEPPGLFRGRGDHPKKGTLKFRLRPEDITLNLGKEAAVPTPNIPGQWKSVQHDNKVTWLATWNENVNGNIKYVFLAANSSLKGQSDMEKFEKARKLKDYIEQIRADYTRDLKEKDMGKRQRATAMYFIDVLALRAGNEKGADEADTVGCCSLRLEHLQLTPPTQLRFDFLGKDSIRYLNVVDVDPQVFKNIKIFKKDKEEEDQIFDRLETTGLNKHLSSLMPGLSAKVFRTYNASWTMQQRLDAVTDDNASISDKLLAYNRANREVAVLCNHQKAVAKGHGASMQKLTEKVLALKYQRMKLRQQGHDLDEATKKKGLLAEKESDLEDNWIQSHEEELEQQDVEKCKKRFEKTQEKKTEAKEELDSEDVLAEQIKDIHAKWKAQKKLTAKGKNEAKASQTVAKIEDAVKKLDERIAAAKMTVVDRDEGSAVALGTSKINYIDPRITVAWAKKHDVPVEKLLSKVLMDKFQWAVEVDEDYVF